MYFQTVIIRAFQIRRQNRNMNPILLLVLAIITNKCISDIASVSGSVTEATLYETNTIISDNVKLNLSNGADKDPKFQFNQPDQFSKNQSHTEKDLMEDVEDSQVEEDSSHDEAYNSIIANYYTADPFFGGTAGGSQNINAPQKDRKIIASEKSKNGKLRHKIRVKSKKTNVANHISMQNLNKYMKREKEESRNQYSPGQRPEDTGNRYPSKRPIVKSLPSRRNYNTSNKKSPNTPSRKSNPNVRDKYLNQLRSSKKLRKNQENGSPYNKIMPNFSDENAFPPNDDWGKDSFYPNNAYPSPYKRNPDLVGPRPEEISQMPKMKIKKLKMRNRNKIVSPEVEKRQITNHKPFGKYEAHMDDNEEVYSDGINNREPVATERQSFSELLPLLEEDSPNKAKNKKKFRPKIKSTGTGNRVRGRNQKKKSNINFKEGNDFPSDGKGNIPLLPDIEGGRDPFNFLDPHDFSGPVIAGLPGGPESHSFFDIMEDFFDEPTNRFPFPGPPPIGPKAKEVPFPKHRYEENRISEPIEFLNPFEGENRQLPDSFPPHLPNLDPFLNEGPNHETFTEKQHYYSHEPRHFPDTVHPSKLHTFDHEHRPHSSHYHKNKLYSERPRPHYPPLKNEYYNIKETESFTKDHRGYVPKISNIQRPFDDASYFPTTNKGHPYAEPLKYHNPLDYSYDPAHVEQFEIRKLPPLSSYHHKYKDHHVPVVHELPRLKHNKYHDAAPVYHAKPDAHPHKHSLEENFKVQSPYAFNLVSNKHKTPYYDDYKDVKFGPPFKRQASHGANERRKGARLLDTPEELVFPDPGFMDIPKLNIAGEMGFPDTQDLSPPPKFEIPEYLARSLNDDLDLQSALFDGEIKDSYDLDAIDRKEVGQINVEQPELQDVTEFAPGDGWLQRSINIPNASFEDESDVLNETEMKYRRNDINLTPPPYINDNLDYDYRSYGEDEDIVQFPALPPPPEMLAMTGGSSLLPIDVPKLGSRIPYEPPELAFDMFYRKAENASPWPMQRKVEPKRASRRVDTERQSKLYSLPDMFSGFNQNDEMSLFGSKKLPFEDEIDAIYSMHDKEGQFESYDAPNNDKHRSNVNERNEIQNNIQGFDANVEEFLPSFDIQKTIDSHYNAGSTIDTHSSTKPKRLSPRPTYLHEPRNYTPSLNEAIKIMEPPKNLEKERQKRISEYQSNNLSFSKLINHPNNEANVPTYSTYDPMEFKYRKERELNLVNPQRSRTNKFPSNDYIHPHQFQSRSLNIDASESQHVPDESSFYQGLTEEDLWEHKISDAADRGSTNRRSLDYGRSLGDGPIPAVVPPPSFLTPDHGPKGRSAESHQFVHVVDWGKFKAGHARGNEYHNIHNVQARDGVQHKEAVTWFDAYGGQGKQYYEYNHADKYGHPHEKKYPHISSRNSIVIENQKI